MCLFQFHTSESTVVLSTAVKATVRPHKLSGMAEQ